jgi:hypothetical protein
MSRHLVLRALLVCLAVLLTFATTATFSPGIASAQRTGKKSVAVGVVEGPQGDTTRKRILEKLKTSGNYEVTDAEDLRPGSDKGAYAAMAQALQVDAILVGKVSRGFDLTLSVIGPDGNLIEDVKLKGGSGDGLNKAIDNDLEVAIADSIAGKKGAKPGAKPPPDEEEEEPEDEEDAAPAGDKEEDEKDEEDEDEDEKPAEEQPAEEKKPGRRPLELLVGARLYSRSFVYSQLRLGNVFDYKLAIAPAIISAARIYPFAFFRDDALGNLGIMAKLEVGIATSTNYAQPQPDGSTLTHQLNTGTSEWQVGLRGRLPLGPHELGIFALYGAHSFVLVGDEGPSADRPNRPYPLVPDVNYTLIRPGVDARLHVSRLTVGAHFAPRFLTSMKQIDQERFWFPGATGSGVDFGAMAAFQILSFLDIAAGVDFLRYGFDFNAIPNDSGLPGSRAPLIAGGATDTYISGWAGILLHFDGKAAAADGSVSVEAKPEAEPEPSDAEPADSEEE